MIATAVEEMEAPQLCVETGQSCQVAPVPEAKPEVKEDSIPLTESERKELVTCEKQIGCLRDAAFLTGSSLKAIQEKRLYREESRTFESYCETKWKMSAQNAYRLINAAKIISVLQESHQIGDENLPTCESHVRPLADGLEEDQWLIAWQQVIEKADGKEVTGTLVEEVVSGNNGKKKRKQKAKAAKPPKGLKGVISLVEKAKVRAEKEKQKWLLSLLDKIQEKINSYLMSFKS